MTSAERQRLVAILARLGSNHDGERAAAGLLATRMLAAKGVSWADLIIPAEPEAETDLAFCIRLASHLTERQRAFIEGVGRYALQSPRQTDIVSQIAERLRARGLE